MFLQRRRLGAAGALALIAAAGLARAEAAPVGRPPKCEGTQSPGAQAPAPADPYPLNAAGWGPELGSGLMASRWAEDWTGVRAAGNAPPLKAVPLGDNASLTLSAEARLRWDGFDNGKLTPANDYGQGLFRGVLGADLRLNRHARLYGEVATGQVEGRRGQTGANFQNDAALQQLFVEVRGQIGPALVGAMVGRQEFADGPRQLVSLSDGPNLHRTWNGVRLYAHGERVRFGAFDLSVTRPGRGAFDEAIDHAERLQGLNASLIVSKPGGPNTYLEPFWIHSENPAFRAGGRRGLDDRDTVGARLWGRRAGLRFDWTVARQIGDFDGRAVGAWGLFAVQSLELSTSGWKPRLTAHVDLASGGGAYGSGTLKAFNPLYASSNYLGEGQFLGLSNLALAAPGVAVSPSARTSLSLEYGLARRLRTEDAAYAGGGRAYPGTQLVSGHEIGGLLRINGSWAAKERLTVFFNYERFGAGDVLKRAGLPSGAYGYVGVTYRY